MNFTIIDTSKQIPIGILTQYARAQQRQLREHYAPYYDGNGDRDEVHIAAPGARIAPSNVVVFLHASSIGAPEDALGVHDLTAAGVPIAHIYLDLARTAGEQWTSIASHEVLEARTDPRLRACVELDDGSIWDREICDRVEADTYLIDHVPLSNFNTPQCFEPSGAPGEFYDWMKLSKAPNEVRPGGYAQRFDPTQGWTQVGEMRAYRKAVAELAMSRWARRRARAARTSAAATAPRH